MARKLSSAAPLAVNNVVLTIAAVIIVPYVLFTSGFKPFISLPPKIIIALIFLGVFCLGLAYWFWTEALRRKPAAKVGAYIYLEPLSTMAVAPFVLNESITVFHILGGGLVILGVWLVEKKSESLEYLKKGRSHARDGGSRPPGGWFGHLVG